MAVLATVSLISGVLQIAGYLVLGRRLRLILLPPLKLWLAVAVGFGFYLLLYTTALVTVQTEPQTAGVNLMDYLWVQQECSERRSLTGVIEAWRVAVNNLDTNAISHHTQSTYEKSGIR